MHQSLGLTREKPRESVPAITNLRLVQVCPSMHLECGVGNFARNCALALATSGVDVASVTEVPADLTADLLIQHEYALFDTATLRNRLAQHRGRVFFLAHSPRTDRHFSDQVDAFITLCDGVTESAQRTLVLPHPGWQRLPLLDRDELKARFNWSSYRCVIGTNGFISPSRQFDEVAKRLLPFAERENILVQVIGTRHHSHDARPSYRDLERRLLELAALYPRHLALETRFLDHEELNHRLQSCDVTWCWTATPSGPYGSGTCADQYGSGTRLIVADKRQHGHVSSLPNVVVAPDDIEGFVKAIQTEASRKKFSRHDPSLLSWEIFAERLVRFVAEVPQRSQAAPNRNNEAVNIAPLPKTRSPELKPVPLTLHSAARAAEAYLERLGPYPARYSGKGVVICAGGIRFLAGAWVLIRTLRRLGCKLPIEVWCYPREVDPHWRTLAKALDVVVRTIPEVAPTANPRWAGWRLKPAAILQSSFREVLYLDADNVPVRDPTDLFDRPEYRDAGTVFWPDRTKTQRGADQWAAFGVQYQDEYELESGQIVLDKAVTWQALNLCCWYNEHAEFFYRYVYGDKDTFRFAWRKTQTRFAVPERPVTELQRVLLQHDFEGDVLFQHRCRDKWNLSGNRRLPGFVFEDQCLAYIGELRARWRPKSAETEPEPTDMGIVANLAGRRFQLIQIGRAAWNIQLGAGGQITDGWTADLALWNVSGSRLVVAAADGTTTVRLSRQADGSWQGDTVSGRRKRILLKPAT